MEICTQFSVGFKINLHFREGILPALPAIATKKNLLNVFHIRIWFKQSIADELSKCAIR